MNAQASFRFYAALNDFLPAERRQRSFIHRFAGRVSIKDMIESLGAPHTEIDLILANGQTVDFAYLVQDGDRISVYPRFAAIDVSAVTLVRAKPLHEARFILDVHLGKLAAHLRLLGFDAAYPENHDDAVLADISHQEQRILLTRDIGLLKRSRVTHGYYVRSTDPEAQVVEVLRRFALFDAIAPFKRCTRCNGLLEPVRKEDIIDRLKPDTRRYYDEFHRCRSCNQIYWRGSHYTRIARFIERVRQSR